MISLSVWLRRGQTLIEYAFVIMLIAIVALGAMTALGTSISSPFAAATSAIETAGGPLPSAAVGGGPTAGEPELVCATDFAPGSEVTVNFNPVGPSQVAGGQIATLIADGSGEVCEEITVPVDAPDGDYHFELIGEDPDGDPITITKPVITVDGQSFDMSVPASPPDASSTAMGTMIVRVRACSAIYHRANATMNSSGYLLAPGYEFEVYATNGWWNNSFTETITGGSWPIYTCDGGSDNTWYQLTDGSGYVFTGGVDIVSTALTVWSSDAEGAQPFNLCSVSGLGWNSTYYRSPSHSVSFSNGDPYVCVPTTAATPVPGATYTFRWYAADFGGAGSQRHAVGFCSNSSGNCSIIGGLTYWNVPDGGIWTLHEVVLTAPANAQRFFWKNDSDHTTYADDFAIIRTN